MSNINGSIVVQNGTVSTICRQCDMHCGINLHIKDGKIIKVTGMKDHPQNSGFICPKGRAASDTVYHKNRLLKPLKRTSDGTFKEIPLERAMDEITEKMIQIKEKHGARSIGVWKGEATGFAQQEEYARRFIHAFGSPNYLPADSQCFSSRYIAYWIMQGYYNTPPDFENSKIVLLWGTNLPISHTVYMKSIHKAQVNGAKLIVIDPRRSEAAQKANIFLKIRPGTDGALAWGLINHLITTNSYDHDFVKNYSVGFDSFSDYASRFTPSYVEAKTGIDREKIAVVGNMIAERKPYITNYVGVSLEHQNNGVNTIRAIVAIGGMCGSVDVKGGEIWPESLGGRTLNLYKELPLLDQKPIGIDKFPLPYYLRHDCHTMTAVDYMLGNGDYPLRGIILTAGNPVNTNANSQKVYNAFKSLDLLVVHDLFLTETAKLAHYILPAASFLERSEIHYYSNIQTISLSTKVLDFPGVTDEYTFFHNLAYKLGFGEKYFPWKNEEEVNRWILEPTSISIDNLKKHPEGIQYKPFRYMKYKYVPLPTLSGKFEFYSNYLKKMGYPELPVWNEPWYIKNHDENFPFVLMTGTRVMNFYHSRFHNIERFSKNEPLPYLAFHPDDANKLNIKNDQKIIVRSKIGFVEAYARIKDKDYILPGVLEMPHGWEGLENPNRLTFDEINDPLSGYPLLNSIPVSIEPAK